MLPNSALPVPAVSVLIDVSSGSDFLDQALQSLSLQTFTDFEIVLLAHGADKRIEAVVARWEARDPRVRAFRSPRLPLAQAHNRVARDARAPLLARLDADDLAMPHRLERQVAMFAADPALGFAGSAVRIIDAGGHSLSVLRNPLGHAAIAEALGRSCPLVHSTLMVRTEAFWRAGGYRQGLNISEDYDLYARLAALTQGDNCAEPLVAYRVHKRSMSGRRRVAMALANEAIGLGLTARQRGLPEPFLNGVPSLRLAARVAGLPREELRQRVLATARQAGFSRALLTGWLPLRYHGLVRSLAIGLGLRPLYTALFRLTQWRARR